MTRVNTGTSANKKEHHAEHASKTHNVNLIADLVCVK